MSDDFNLFRETLSDVKPLKTKTETVRHDKTQLPKQQARLKQAAAMSQLDDSNNEMTLAEVPMIAADDPISYKKDGVQEGVFRNLRLGKYEIHTVLNLHGKSVEAARTAVFEFIQDCQKANLRSVLIQHGRGLKSANGKAMLKSYLNAWLPNLPSVLAFHSALPQHGGVGAAYVLLKKSEDERMMNRERHQKRSKSSK